MDRLFPIQPDLQEIDNRLAAAKVVVYDSETDGLDFKRNKIVGHVLTFSGDPRDSFYLPVAHGGGENMNKSKVHRLIKKHAKRLTLRWVGHYLDFDLKMMHGEGISIPEGPLEDTLIDCFLADERLGSFSLERCCKAYGVQEKKGDDLYKHIAGLFGCEPTRRSAMGHYWRLAGNDPIGVDYAVGDGTSTWQLWERIQRELDRGHWNGYNLRQIWDIESRLIRVLTRMQIRGIRVDEERLALVRTATERQIEIALSALPPGLESPKARTELIKVFTDAGITDWPTTAIGNPSFSEEWLLTNDLGCKIVTARKLIHLRDSFIKPLQERHLFNGRVHCTYNQTRGEVFGVQTGRLSCQDPNMQAVHKRNKMLGAWYRSVFYPDIDRVWANADYAQIEPCLLAHYGQVKVLLEGYLGTPRIDAHSAVAKSANIDRELGKRLNQAMLTGAGNDKVASMLGLPPEEAAPIVMKYFHSMPEIKDIQKKASAVMRERGEVRSLLGRFAHLEKAGKEYKALNRLLQCGNADVIKKAMVDIDEYFASEGDRVHLINSIHDDLAFQFHEEDRRQYEHALDLMRDYGPGRGIELSVPLEVEPGEGANWGEATYGVKTVIEAYSKMGVDYHA